MKFPIRLRLTVCLSALIMIAGSAHLGAQTIAMKTQYIYLINDSSADLSIMVTRTINSMNMTNFATDSAYADSYFCFGMGCYPSTQDISPYEPIPGCSVDQTFMAYYKIKDSIAINDTSSVTYCFKEENNPGVEKCFTFLIGYNSPSSLHEDTVVFGSGCPVASVGSDLFNVPSISIYPNPAREWITVDYTLVEKTENAWFVLRNMLGAVSLKMKLHGSSGKIKIPAGDFNPGIYFYSLMADDITYSTNKLIIDN